MGASALSSLQPVDLLLHLVREFEDINITHFNSSVDPLRDIEVVNNELMQFVSSHFHLLWRNLVHKLLNLQKFDI